MYSKFVNERIKTRELIIEDRKIIYDWNVSELVPSFFLEKIDELKLIVWLGLDNIALKSLILLLEEIMLHVLIASEIKFEDEYVELFSKIENEKKLRYGWQILNELKKKNLIHSEDYEFCSKFFNDEKNGGQRLRNIEIHNLIHEKINRFEIRAEFRKNMDEWSERVTTEWIKKKPAFVHIGARDMVTRDILNNLAGLISFVNRSSITLSHICNVPDKVSYGITNSLPVAITFFAEVQLNGVKTNVVESDIYKLGDVDKIEIINNDCNNIKFIIKTHKEHSSLEFMQGLYKVKHGQYEWGTIGIYKN